MYEAPELPVESDIFKLLVKVSQFLVNRGVRAYLVGGFIRDLLLGRKTADIDIAVAADGREIASETASTFNGRYVPLDEVNKVARVVLLEQAHSQLDFSWFGESIEKDLLRRDFTINAMAIDLRDLTGGPGIVSSLISGYRSKSPANLPQLIDPSGGWRDLHESVIRAVSDSVFTSDPVRMLRAVRLAAELNFNIDPRAELLIEDCHHLINRVAGERLREELLRILSSHRTGQELHYLDQLGLLTSIIPELAASKGVEQPKEHYWDVFEHSLETAAVVDFLLRQGDWKYTTPGILASVPWSNELARHFAGEVSSGSTRRTMLKISALLHDIAKPQTKAFKDGRMRFLGHPKEGASNAADISKRLRFSAKEIRLVELSVEHHLRPTQMSHEGMPTRRAIYRYFRDLKEAAIDTLFLSLADHLAARGPHLDPAEWQNHTQVVSYILDQHYHGENIVKPPKLISGHDLIEIFRLEPGAEIGRLLEAAREAQAAGEVTTREEALTFIRNKLKDKTG